MKTKQEYFFCRPRLLKNVEEINEIDVCIENVKWQKQFKIDINNQIFEHQSGYNKAFEIEFAKLGWESQPLLYDNPRLIGDLQKNDIFVEIQFGNSAS